MCFWFYFILAQQSMRETVSFPEGDVQYHNGFESFFWFWKSQWIPSFVLFLIKTIIANWKKLNTNVHICMSSLEGNRKHIQTWVLTAHGTLPWEDWRNGRVLNPFSIRTMKRFGNGIEAVLFLEVQWPHHLSSSLGAGWPTAGLGQSL